MNTTFLQLDVVSLEASIFSGKVQYIQITGIEGEMGIRYGHAPLLTAIKPGMVRIVDESGDESLIYLSGGMLEVQASNVNVLADLAVRAEDLNESSALAAKRKAEQELNDTGKEFDHTAAAQELAQAVAQLQLIKKLKQK